MSVSVFVVPPPDNVSGLQTFSLLGVPRDSKISLGVPLMENRLENAALGLWDLKMTVILI